MVHGCFICFIGLHVCVFLVFLLIFHRFSVVGVPLTIARRASSGPWVFHLFHWFAYVCPCCFIVFQCFSVIGMHLTIARRASSGPCVFHLFHWFACVFPCFLLMCPCFSVIGVHMTITRRASSGPWVFHLLHTHARTQLASRSQRAAQSISQRASNQVTM